MSMHNYGVYHQGARFSCNDFDTIKLIDFFLEDIQISLSERSLGKLRERKFDLETAKELCDVFELPFPENEPADYNFLHDDLLDEIDDFFYVGEDQVAPLGNAYVYSIIFHDLEGEFYIEGESEALDDSVMMLAFAFPYAWNINSYKGPKTRQEAVEMLRESGKRLLKDDVDWNQRLGHLIASDFC